MCSSDLAHSLRLQQERLEDLTDKKRQLARRIDEKRLELLRLKQSQLEAMKKQDPELETRIAELAEKVRAYEAPPVVPETPKGMVQLGKKLADGSIQRIETDSAAASAAE